VNDVSNKNPRKDTDSPWKEVIDLFFKDFLSLCYPEIFKDIVWEKGYEFLDKELQTINKKTLIRKKIVDKLIKVWQKSGKEAWVLLHLEIQGQKDINFSERMFTYYYRLFDRYHVPISSIAILIDDNAKWYPYYYENSLWCTKIHYHFNVIKVLDYKNKHKQLELSKNPFAMILLTQLTALETKKKNEHLRLESKINLTRQLYEKGWTKKQIFGLYKFLDWMIQLPKNLVLEYEQQLHQIEEDKQMPYITSLEKLGLERGLQQGLQQGLEQGKQEGVLEGEINILSRQLKRKFSPLSTNYQQRLKSADAQTLMRWAERILEAKTLEDVFQD
jgi:flagellar biosynthesis/type III secretory pathway protein FliH